MGPAIKHVSMKVFSCGVAAAAAAAAAAAEAEVEVEADVGEGGMPMPILTTLHSCRTSVSNRDASCLLPWYATRHFCCPLVYKLCRPSRHELSPGSV